MECDRPQRTGPLDHNPVPPKCTRAVEVELEYRGKRPAIPIDPPETTDADTKRVERIWELDEAVRQIARMKVFPDDKVNRMTLVAAIEIARRVIHD